MKIPIATLAVALPVALLLNACDTPHTVIVHNSHPYAHHDAYYYAHHPHPPHPHDPYEAVTVAPHDGMYFRKGHWKWNDDQWIWVHGVWVGHA